MLCPLCNQRKARRQCPAVGRQICSVCCGTKRLVEIRCPADCAYLSTAQHHPPAVVQRQQESDRALMLPLLQGLTERQAQVFLMAGALTARYQADALQKLRDEDIGQAAGALAATLETAGRGIVYEHQPASLPAARLMTEMKAMVDEMVKTTGPALERDAAIALRKLESAAQVMQKADPGGTALQRFLARILQAQPGESREQPAAQPSPLILP